MTPQTELEIRVECGAVLTAFAHHIDNREFDKVVALFTEDAVFERPHITHTGRAELAALWGKRSPTMFTRHLFSPPFFVEISPERVRTVSPFTLYQFEHFEEGPPNRNIPSGIAEFHDTFRREPEGWRIAYRRGVTLITCR